MIDNIVNWLLGWRAVRAFRLRTAPRWVILLIDMLIVAMSYVMVMLADYYARGTAYSSLPLIVNALIVLSVYFMVIFVSKSYTAVIRLSVIEDLYRVIQVVVISTFILLFIDMAIVVFKGAPLYRFWNVLSIAAIVFTTMVIERLLIKYLYMRLTAAASDGRRRVLVLGTSLNSVSSSRQGNKQLKNLLVFSCSCLARGQGYYREYYERCRDRGMPYKAAIKAVARKRLKVIYAVMRDVRPYVA